MQADRPALRQVIPKRGHDFAILWCLVRDQIVCVCVYYGEGTVSVPAGTTLLNDRSDDRCCNAEYRLLQVQTNAASAKCPNINVGKVPRLARSFALLRKAVLLDLTFVDHAAKASGEPILTDAAWSTNGRSRDGKW